MREGLIGTVIRSGVLAAVSIILGAPTADAQVASPLQPGHYAPGLINIRDLVTPPPGLFVLWYNWYVWSGIYVDRNGNELSSLNLNQINPSLPNVDIDLSTKGFVTVPAIFWASTFTLLGGARYEASVSPSFLIADFTIVADPGGPGFLPVEDRTIEGSVSGFSDLFVSPVGLSWALGRFEDASYTDEEALAYGLPPPRRFNLTFTYSFYAPTGSYESGADDNVGVGFWTHQFQGFGFFFPVASQATAIMAGLTFELNSKIKDVDITPGSRVSLEWGVSHYFTSWFEAGVQGAHNWQISDDSGSDVFWDPSVHDRRNTLLFGAGLWPIQGHLYVAAKYGFDYAVRQRFDSNNLMLNFIWVPHVLDGM